MRRVTKLAAAVTATAALALTATACGESSTESGGKKNKGVGLAFDVGGRDDHSFNEAAARGTDKAEKELGVKTKEMTAGNNETEETREQRLTSLAKAGYNPVIGVGFNYGKSVNKVAKDFPDTTFGVVDERSHAKNVVGMTFAENESSYLVGVAAAKKTKSNKVSFIGGVDNALIQKFEAGYVKGVKDTNPKAKVEVDYLYKDDDKGFNDPDRAQKMAKGMLARGNDVIYTAAGGSGSGSIEEVSKKKGAWAIGVDSDQYRQKGLEKYRDAILTSSVKNVDVAVFELIKSIKDKKPLTGNQTFSLKEKGVSVATSGGFIDDIKDDIDKATEKIVSGEVKVPTRP
ncbi:BMP family ABC transporter substrate-binding protein [Streptomyces sp. A73]|uniref:BMP family lipoprotein n=1 Tax=unclassified Streptomyces TaxID=2593676 RepID=UPI000C184E3C|nr:MULTISPECIES: BMP family ABC transporter substrate-binding protein [unclassified Streptomyces]MBQ0867558.1 BMP family ABC transporter substrate-binding protein [Streptomyces sp. RK75]MBQ1123183.1 BMP family ABC transporter substrate-binding protein [Streptomyces sp. B15]MBQ1161131.1 BMP family ABC transporter substrate-binding protein [Streptomyces sp. A73]